MHVNDTWCAIALGSNLGDRHALVASALDALSQVDGLLEADSRAERSRETQGDGLTAAITIKATTFVTAPRIITMISSTTYISNQVTL